MIWSFFLSSSLFPSACGTPGWLWVGGGCFTLQLEVLLQMLDLFLLLHEATSGLCFIFITEWHELFLLMILQSRLITTVSCGLSLQEIFGTLLFQSVTNEAHHCIESSETDIYRILRWFHSAIQNQNLFIVPWRTHRRQGDNVTLRKSFCRLCQHPITTAWGQRLKFIRKWRIKKANRTSDFLGFCQQFRLLFRFPKHAAIQKVKTDSIKPPLRRDGRFKTHFIFKDHTEILDVLKLIISLLYRHHFIR